MITPRSRAVENRAYGALAIKHALRNAEDPRGPEDPCLYLNADFKWHSFLGFRKANKVKEGKRKEDANGEKSGAAEPVAQHFKNGEMTFWLHFHHVSRRGKSHSPKSTGNQTHVRRSIFRVCKHPSAKSIIMILPA